MARLIVGPGLLNQTFETLQECGRGRSECVVYWTGPLDDPARVVEVVHPVHRAGPVGYEVESGWVTDFFLRLRRERKAARVQVHTHPGRAGHSETDDTYALVPATGFLSLVIPRYARGPVSVQGAALVEMQSDGTWAERAPEVVLLG